MNALISAKNISVIKSGKNILNDVSIDINKNDFITIIGPNGAGKSMLLKCLMGFYKPNIGAIKTKPNLKFGYMPQNLDVIKTIPMKAKLFITIKKKFDKISLKKVISEVTGKGMESLSIFISSRIQVFTSLEVNSSMEEFST